MPILEISSTQVPKNLQEFTKRMSTIFAEYIGKPEDYCLVTYTKVDSLYFAGSDAPGYLVKVGSIGHIDNERNSKLTNAVTEELTKELKVEDSRGYFIFTDVPAENIGHKSTTYAKLLKQ